MDVPKINPRAAEPPHRQIAAWLRGRIEAGEFEPDVDPLPSEAWLWQLPERRPRTRGWRA
ncbi:MAG TPA: hypothetical protein VIV12_05340 [Streptosporangiaceae bacterium]